MNKFGPQHFLNRELSWLAFNQRVLDEALDPRNPLLERVKFFCIFSSNLDEFFEVRVAGIKQQIESDIVERSMDGLTASETFRAVQRRVRQMVEQQYACWREQLLPQLAEHGIQFLSFPAVDARDAQWIENCYRTEVRPVLTPLGIDPAHPFPQLLNKSLNMIVELDVKQQGEAPAARSVIQSPPRLVKLPRDDSRQDYVFLNTSFSIIWRTCFRALISAASGSFGSHATANFTSTRKKRPASSMRSKPNCTTGAKAMPFVWKSSGIVQFQFGNFSSRHFFWPRKIFT
jgi:polyphosphate kinase